MVERKWELYQSEDSNQTHNKPVEWRKREKSRRQKQRAEKANRKALALLLKSASPTTENTESQRLFQKDTERGTEGRRYWEVLQRGGANECLWATKAQRIKRTGIYGKDSAPLEGCIGLLLILNSMQNSATDRRWARFHSKTPWAKKTAHLTSLSSSLRSELTA